MRYSRGEAEQDCLADRAADRHDERRHHCLGMTRLQPVQCAEQDRAWDEQPSVTDTLLD